MKAMFLILFCSQIAICDVTPSHAIQGGLVGVWTARLAGGDRSTCLIVGGLGAILGALPDIQGAMGNIQGDNWRAYHVAHRLDLGLSYLPPVRLHLWTDKWYHDRPGNWWQRKWPLAVMTWVIEAVLVWITWEWVLPEK